MLKFTKITVLLALFACLVFFACAESDTLNEFENEISSSSNISGNSGNSSSSCVETVGDVEIPDNMAQRDGKCYICNPERGTTGANSCADWDNWIKNEKCENTNQALDPFWCSETDCPSGGIVSECPEPSSSSDISIGNSSSSSIPASGGDIGTPIGGGKNLAGWASRYWDGCKASCGWSANAGGNPTKSCSINGTSVVDMDAQSSCNGGNAYTCYSQAPWAVSDNVAYGFAASHTNGDCGKCFRLTFTGQSEHVANAQGLSNLSKKTMVVKVSNIGGDVGGTQLDLMVPGGGVGIFDSFSGQTGVNGNVIRSSAQYGGFLADCESNTNNLANLKTCLKNKCTQAFTNADLLAGCNFYADWLEAVNNPRFNLVEVSCPKELQDKW